MGGNLNALKALTQSIDKVMPELILKRYKSEDKQMLGKLYYNDKVLLETLELPWKNNQKKISCIPANKYKVLPRTSEKYGKHFHILDVPNRDFILVHSGNFYTDILGCILVGTKLSDVNKDGYMDVINSKIAMNLLLKQFGNGFNLTIINDY